MWKFIVGIIGGVAVTLLLATQMASRLMFSERESPFGMEETIARIQQNIQQAGNGWSLIGLRNAARPIQKEGGNILPVMMIEACSTKYSKPILSDDSVRFLSILIPCKISVYKKDDGKTYIGTMNAGLMGKVFGSNVASVMANVAIDQATFLQFDPSKPAPKMIEGTPGGDSKSGGTGSGGGC
jgi:uncharacterized protein (DUF302 family)